MLRLLLSALLGLAVCALLLLAMALLIGGGPTATPAQRPAPRIEVVLVDSTTAPPEPHHQPPPPLPTPPPPAPPAAAVTNVAAPATTAPQLDLTMPPLTAPNAGLAGTVLALAVAEGGALAATAGAGIAATAGAGPKGAAGGAALPLVRIEPRYPPKALREGKEGWVKLRFTIAADGTTKDIEVLDAKPRRLFEAEARRALARWKYQPRIVDGRAVEQPGELVQLDFVLERQ